MQSVYLVINYNKKVHTLYYCIVCSTDRVVSYILLYLPTSIYTFRKYRTFLSVGLSSSRGDVSTLSLCDVGVPCL